MHEALIALGSNLGDRQAYLEKALVLIEAEIGQVTARSAWRETEPVGPADRLFLNGAAVCRSRLTPEACLTALLDIERRLGRERKVHWGNRTVDLDLILWRTDEKPVVRDSEVLSLPHPAMLERRFVLDPAAEVAADWIHPHTGKTVLQHLSDLALEQAPES